MATKYDVTLNDENDLSRPTSKTSEVSLNGHTTKSFYQAADNSITTTTPSGRIVRQILDSKGWTIQSQVPGLANSNYICRFADFSIVLNIL
jgi:hypothetical protein